MFGGTGGAEASADAVKVLVGIAGVADQLPDGVARRQGSEQAAEGRGDVWSAGGEDADGAAGRDEAGFLYETGEGGAVHVERGDGEVAESAGFAGSAAGPGGLKRIADGTDSAGARGGEKRAQHAREEMSVLMRVHVGDAEASIVQTADLGRGFGFDFGGANAAGVKIADERGKGWTESLAVGAEGGDLGRREGWRSVDKKDMAADFEGGMGAGGLDGVVEERAGGHESGRGERAGLVELGDGAVDARGEAEVVGVDDKLGH